MIQWLLVIIIAGLSAWYLLKILARAFSADGGTCTRQGCANCHIAPSQKADAEQA